MKLIEVLLGPKLSVYASSCIPPACASTQCNQQCRNRNMDTVLKKTTDLCKPVRWKLLDMLVVTILWIISTHSYDFVIFLSLRFRLEQRASIRSYAPGSQHHKRFPIFERGINSCSGVSSGVHSICQDWLEH
jgi:hypothetical protein